MSCFKIYWDNFIDLDDLAGSDVSSEQAAFPITNAYNTQRRSKVWRSNGYFKIDDTNNVIIFRETSGGPDLTATIAELEYDNTTDFIAAVKTALDDAGASTYTVTNTSANGFKFQITSNGAGGSGVFHLMLTDSDFTAEDVLGFSNSSDLTDTSLIRTADFLRICTEEFIQWDLGVASNPTGFALIGPRNTPIKLSPSGTYKLQGNITNNWSSPEFTTTLTYSDNAFYVTDETGLADNSYRFWRFQMVDQNPYGYCEVGAFMLGNSFQPDRGRVQFPIECSMVDSTNLLYSEGGQTYADIKPKTAIWNVEWKGLKKEDIEEIEAQFAIYGTGIPFMVVTDADAVFSTSANLRVIYARFSREPTFQLDSPNNFSCSMSFREDL